MRDIIRIAIHGAAGKMGRRLVALASEDRQLKVVAALDSPQCPSLGHDAGETAGVGNLGVPIGTELPEHVEVVIDFSSPEGAVNIANLCSQRRIPLVEATTGLSESQREQVLAAGQQAALVTSPSMSLAVNVAMKLVTEAAKALKQLPSGVDVEIVETHHRYKEDAPSGTALKFGQLVVSQMGQSEHRHGREGKVGRRPANEIGYHALHAGDNVGEHHVIFGMLGESLEVSVRGHTRDSYAYGALAAAKFAASKPAGVYSMADVLGLE